MNIQIPYGKSSFDLNSDNCVVLHSKAHAYQPKLSPPELVQSALENPIGTKRLSDLAAGKKRALVITSDHTRPVPSQTTLPLLLRELRLLNPGVEVRILIATGFHRPMTQGEMLLKFGEGIVNREELINHISQDDDAMVFKGILPSGGELWLNNLVDWADLIVSEGFIEPHFFAGFSGGRKSVLPGISSAKTVLANHCSEFIASEAARTGNLAGNPIHEDMLFAAQKVGLAFILNVVIDADKNVIAAFSGDPFEAHDKGCEFVKSLAVVKAVKSPVVITSNGGYPLDQNVYQAVKGMTAAERCVEDGGVIIMAASCSDGHGGEGFYNWFKNAASPKDVAKKIEGISRKDTLPDQWEAQILARILNKCTVIMVAEPSAKEIIENMHMTYAPDIETALNAAFEIAGRGQITVIPDGVSVILE